MGTIHTCDRCGVVLHHGEMWTVTEKRVGCAAGRQHLLCGSCLATVAAAIHMAIDVAKDELRGDAE
jgi:hypothetical protein